MLANKRSIVLGSVVRKLDCAIHQIVFFFKRCKNVQKAIKLQMWAEQLIKAKSNFQTLKFNLS